MVQNNITQQLKKNAQGKPIPPKMADEAFDLNKSKADNQGLSHSDPEYWQTVTSGTLDDLEMFPKTDTYKKQPFNPQGGGQQRGMRTPAMFQREKYIPFEEALERPETKNGGDRDEHLKGYSKVELAKELAKELKKRGASRNEIIHSIINRNGLSIGVVANIVDGKDTEEEDHDGGNIEDPLHMPQTSEAPNDVNVRYDDLMIDKTKSDKKKSKRS